MPTLLFYYDIACPYAYIASTQIEALAARTGAALSWQPVLLGGIYKQLQSPQLPTTSWSAARATLGAQDLIRQAAWRGVPLQVPPTHPQRTVSAMRLLVATPPAQRGALTKALYRAYWVLGQDVTDRAVLDPLAAACGVDPAVIDSPEAREGLYASTAEAIAHGAFGVPSMVVGDTMWWGQDRLHLVAAALGAPRSPLPEPTGPPPVDRITFFHDFSSPFSYLASTQIEALARKYGVNIDWKPILLGALFREIGTPDVPLLTMSAAKRAYFERDMADWATWWRVPLRFPTAFPIRTVLPLRVALLEPLATRPLYRALWADDRDISQPDIVRAVLHEAGLDPALVEATGQPAVKAKLRTNTAAARDAGACGVPTVQVGEQLIWGQDRLTMLADVLAGRLTLTSADADA
jgi:2-hydroxychromene-2-carboxylate isomerase